MAASVEARVPFCDPRLIELALALPASSKLAWRSRLHRVRAAMQPIARFSERADRGEVLRRLYGPRLPDRVTMRRKMGFQTPLRAWMQGPLRDLSKEMLEAPDSLLFKFFRPEPIRHWLAQSHHGDDGPSRKLWMLMTLGLFLSGLGHAHSGRARQREYNVPRC